MQDFNSKAKLKKINKATLANGQFFQKANHVGQDRYKVWLRQAEYDLKAAEFMLRNGYFEWVCYQSIQSVEKAFKSVIVHSGYRPPKTHKLGVLISMSNRANPAFLNIKLNFRKIEGFTFISRYPFVIPGQNMTPHEMINRQDAETCLRLANDIIIKINDFLKEQKMGEDRNIDMDDYYFTPEEIDAKKKQLKEIAEKNNDPKIKIKKIIMFGSFAREDVRPRSSTMDVLVIAETELGFVERIQYFRGLTKGTEPIVEPLVYTPEEFTSMVEQEGEGFLESAIEEGSVLFEK